MPVVLDNIRTEFVGFRADPVDSERTWKIVEKLIKNACEDELDEGFIPTVAQRWRQSKGWLLPHFDPDGRWIRRVPSDPRQAEKNLEAVLEVFLTSVEYLSIFHRYPDLSSKTSPGMAGEFLKDLLLKGKLASADEILGNRLRSRRFFKDGNRLDAGARFSKLLSLHIQKQYGEQDGGAGFLRNWSESKIESLAHFAVDVYGRILTRLFNNADLQVVLSVHPLDILAASLHTRGWSSCHDLYDGQYRTGPLSYLLDEATVVAYAFESTDAFLDIKDYPVKLWRQMVYLDPGQGAVFSREYPHVMPAVARQVRQMTGALLSAIAGVEPRWKVQSRSDWVVLLEDEQDDQEHVFRKDYTNRTWFYFDEPMATLRLEGADGTILPAIGADEIPCAFCGVWRSTGDTRSLACEACYGKNHVYCCICEITVDEDDAQWYDGEPYCDDCFHGAFTHCDRCDETIWRDDACSVNNGDLIYCRWCVTLCTG